MSNPADAHIAKLIEKLASRHGSILVNDDEIIDQIAKLRASMEPKQIIKKQN